MADLRGKQLPNLKISVDNTESTEESEDEVEISDDNELSIHDEESDHLEVSDDDKDEEKSDVEFNVRIGSTAERKLKKHDRPGDLGDGGLPSDQMKPDSSSGKKGINDEKEKAPPQLPDKRVYENKMGGFVTGIDVTSKEAQEKREQRAKRFRIHPAEESQAEEDVQALYKSLGMKESDFERLDKRLRKGALHLRGTDDMSTKDVFDYFTQFPANGIEWINDTSCNVVWLDKVTCVRAMLRLSTSYKEAMAAEAKRNPESAKDREKRKKEERQKKKKKESKDEAKKPDKDNNNDSTENGTTTTTTTTTATAGQLEAGAEEEKMEVDEELDLVADEDTEQSQATAGVSMETEKPDFSESRSEEGVSKRTSGQKGASSSKDDQSGRKKKAKKEQAKEKKKEGEKEEEGADSDSSSSSSSSSSSGSSSGSGSGSSGSSSSDSDSSSSSGSDSESSSDLELDGDEEKKKKRKKALKREADTGEIVQDGDGKEHTIPWPPGKWRLGLPCKKARHLFMRFATLDDKKTVGAEKKSQYYQKYGNPNYGGMKGLISSSRKRKMRYEKLDKEVKSKGPDAREAIDKKRADRQRQRQDEREEGELSHEELEQDSGEEVEEVMVEKPKPKDLRQLLNRDPSKSAAAAPWPREDRSLDKVTVKKRQREESVTFSDDEMDLDAELEQLMERPVKKRMMMRMHADEEEEKIKAKRSGTGLGLLTVVASSRETKVPSRLAGRLGGRLQLPARQETASVRETGHRRGQDHAWSSEAKVLNSEDDEEEEPEEEEPEEEEDDFAKALASYRSLRNIPDPKPKVSAVSKPRSKSSLSAKSSLDDRRGGGDLRSRLGGAVSSRDSDKRSFPAMRIEVLDDEEEEEEDV